jgi:multiple sugar transport system ATP-binding protein
VVDDGRIRLADGSLDVAIPPDATVQRSDRVRVGLRPSDINVTSGEGSLRGRVLLAERLGRNIELTVDVGGAELIVLSSGRQGLSEGDTVTMTIADSDVHVFEAGDGDTRRMSADRDAKLEAAK